MGPCASDGKGIVNVYESKSRSKTLKVTSANSRLSIDRSRDLKDSFFDPDLVHTTGPGGCLRGAMAQRSNMVSGSYAESTQNNLFKPNNFQHGADLLSINQAVGCLKS